MTALPRWRLAALGVVVAGMCLAGRAGAAALQAAGPAQVAPPVGAGATPAAPAPPGSLPATSAPATPATTPQAAGAGGSFTLSLPQAFEMALAANRALAAARLGRPIAQANVAVAGERPNPDLLLEKLRETPHEAATLSLPIETAGKRHRRIAAAEADAASGEAEIARTTAATRNQVRRAFYALLAAQRRAVEEQASLDIAQRAAGAARARFEAGAAPRLDALQAELVVSQASNDAEGARGMLAAARSQLNTLVDRPPLAAVTAEGELAAGTVPQVDAAIAGALAHSTELALADRRIAAQAARVALARAQQVPNPVVQGAITHGAEPDFEWGWRAGLTVTLPIFTQHRPEVEVEETTLKQLQAQRDASAAQIAGAVTAAASQAAQALRQALRFRDDILPHALEVEAMAEESYRSGETGLVVLLQALQSARDVRLRAVQAGIDYQIALAELEQAVGAPLP